MLNRHENAGMLPCIVKTCKLQLKLVRLKGRVSGFFIACQSD